MTHFDTAAIHGDGKVHMGTFAAFAALTGHQKMFDRVASNVVSMAESDRATDADAMLSRQFTKFSGRPFST